MPGKRRSSSPEPGASGAAGAYRRIPSVNDLADAAPLAAWRERVPRSLVVTAAQAVLAEHRGRLAQSPHVETPTLEAFAARVAARLDAAGRAPLAPVINATGILIHTGLGRAPLPASAVDALAAVARGYAPVELDLATGERGRRADLVQGLLCELTGAEAATAVNNGAAALMLALAAIARGKSVIVSRGELIEIGGSFRLPELMEAGGAHLREVGTTNKTRRQDYERAIDETTAAILKVHPSNYRIEGFTQDVTLDELVRLGREHEVPVIHDIGSGALRPMTDYGLADEPDARSSVAAGADLVMFSGDKLLGGPQAGIIVGRTAWVQRLDRHPMMRALRLDKIALSALAATLQLHRDPELAARRVPVLAMLRTPVSDLEDRGRRIVETLRVVAGVATVEMTPAEVFLGGGALPTRGLESRAIRVTARSMSEEELAKRLRTGAHPVVPRVHAGAVCFDLRSVRPEEDEALTAAIEAVLGRDDGLTG